ncbi:MAG: SPOR domain-containing protein [Gammaproteobacteria bacterium]|nr:SPOR domain-containing protein [Gammaproteobacteria bacterium]
MSNTHIRHRSRGRYYKSPILLDHRNLKWIWLSVGLFAFITFFGGYILGFEKSNNKWMAKLDPVEIALPNAGISALAMVEAQPPEIDEPGASIDVDSVGEGDDKTLSVANNPDAYTGLEVAVVETNAQASIETSKTKLLTTVSRIGELAMNDSEIESLPGHATEELTIVDDASEETARYSIQVGMYSDFGNASTRVAELLNLELSAYLDEYQNKKDETRYNVRFGYFSSYSSGQQALSRYEKYYSGAGYVARIEP